MAHEQEKRPVGRPPKYDNAMRQINVRLPESDLAWLDDVSEREGRIGRNAVLRKLIRQARQT